MNKTLCGFITALTIAAGVLALAAGCATTGNNQTEQAIITDAAYLGTLYELQQNPGTRPAFVAAEAVLQGYASGTGVPAAPIEQILANSGQTNALMLAGIVSGIQLADAFINSNTNSTSQAAQQAAGWVATGIGEGLGTLPVAHPIKRP